MASHYAVIEGKKYVCILPTVGESKNKTVWIRSVRTKKDGTEIEAFLSIHQRAAEARAKRHFAKEIKEYLAS